MDLLNKIVVTGISDIITFGSPKGRFKEIKNRKNYGISFCTEGQITYTHKGKKYISNSSNAIILPQNETYTLYGDKNGIFPVINFTCMDFLCDTMIVIPINNVDSYIKDYEQMKSLSLFEKNRTKVMGIFYNMLYKLSDSEGIYSNVLFPAVKYLEENYHDPTLTNHTLAKKCDLSEVHFRKLFTEHYKTTPKQYIIDIRIDKAKQLLTDGVLKINAISEKCGFANPYHFCRLFKEKTGITPTEYMKENKINKI